MLNNVFGNETNVSNRCNIFSFAKNEKTIMDLEEWASYSVVNHTLLHVDFANFLSYIDVKLSNNQIGVVETSQKRKIAFTKDEILYYREAGIDVFGQFVNEINPIWDFYYGAEITWQELASDMDVKRTGYEKFKQNILSIINNPRQKTITYTLKHHPGAGGTTMSRRLAFDLCKMDSELEKFSCLPVFLYSYNEKTYEYLLSLSENKLDNDFLVLIVEGGDVADENLNKLSTRLNSRQRNVIILRVFRTTKPIIQGGFNTTTLSSKLDEDDAKLFIDKYTNHKKSNNFIFSQEDIKFGLEVVDFPLKLNDDITSCRLNSYVSAFMDDMSDDVKKFTGYVAFAEYYAGKSLNHNLVKSLLGSVSDLSQSKDSIQKLLIQELDKEGKLSGCWKPRYQSFALPILNKVWGKNWKLRIGQISIDFLKECEKVGTIGQWDKDLLYSVFILRRGADFKETIEDTRSKFAKLIQDVMSNEQRPEEIYNALVEIYPDDSVFLGHYGRYLYEQAYIKRVSYKDALYSRADELISSAIKISPNVDDNYHMMGMLNLRKIQAAKNDVSKNDFDIDLFSFEDMINEWMLLAKNGFEKSIDINPASPYGFTAQCQLYSECLKLAKLMKKSDDFTFCDTDPIYIEIIDLLGSSLNQLGNICQTYDEEQPYMVKSMQIYNQIRAFHRQVIGDPQAAVDHYRKLYEASSSLSKSFYGKQFITSILYARTEGLPNKNNTAWAMGHLSATDRAEVSRVLQYQRTQSDLDSYENLFWFKMSGNEEFPLDEAINLLIEWLNQYENNGKTGGGKLKATYYIAVCYSAMAINSNSYNEDYIRSAKKYFKLAGELAESFERSALTAFSYMGYEQDAHSILQPSQMDDAKKYDAIISKIDRRKGYVNLPCGLEAFFPSKGFNSLADEGKTYLRGYIGFRYSGLGFYKFERVTNNTLDQLAEISDRLDQKEQEIESPKLPIKEEIFLPTKNLKSNINIKQIGKIDLDSIQTTKCNDFNLKHGVFYKSKFGGIKKVIESVTKYSYIVRSICNEEELYDECEVSFILKSEINKKDHNKKFYYAADVKLDE